MLLDTVAEAMPHYPLDASFEDALPGDLSLYIDRWRKRRPAPAQPS